MSKPASKMLIGGFVVGAMALIVAGVLIFGTGAFLSERARFVLYFRGSVKGLNVGAPVMFRGAKIGSVKDIVLRFNAIDMSVHIPVIIEIEAERITRVNSSSELQTYFDLLVEHGLRAQLQVQSMVTGQLMINFDFYPDKPAKRAGIAGEYPELPTVPSSLEELSETIEDLPLGKLFSKLLLTIEGIERVVNFPQVTESIHSLNQALEDVQRLVKNIDSRLVPLTSSIEETLRDTQYLMGNIDDQVGRVVSDIEEISKAGRAVLKQTENTITTVEGMAAENSPLRYLLTDTLEQLSDAARSIRVMADYIERHPEALLRGKGGSRGK